MFHDYADFGVVFGSICLYRPLSMKIEFNVAGLAQSVEHGTLNPRVVGSSPTFG